MNQIKLKTKTLSLKDFYTSFLLLTTYLDNKYAEVLAVLMKHYPAKYIDEEIKSELVKVLSVENKKKDYQNQIISKTLTYLSNEGYLIKIQNGVYELNKNYQYVIKKVKKEKQLELFFSFKIDEL